MRGAGLLFLALALGAWIPSCVTDHDALARRPTGSGGTKGGGGSGGSKQDSGSDAGESGEASGGSAGGVLEASTDADAEPEGPNELTLLHGVVDSLQIAFCFSKAIDGLPGDASGTPLPGSGLDFGEHVAIGAISGFDFGTDSILPYVIAGDLSLVAGLDCQAAIALAESVEADAGSGSDAASDALASDAEADASDAALDDVADAGPTVPALRVRKLPILPAGTLSGGRSYLLVASGCVGGAAFDDPAKELVCGTGYQPHRPTLAPVLVAMSRTTLGGKLGVQFVHASRATEDVDVVSQTASESGDPPVTIVRGVTPGAIEPDAPNVSQPKVGYGFPIGDSVLQVMQVGSNFAMLTVKWSDAIVRGGLSEVHDGQTYALVLIGPRASVAGFNWWNAPAITIVPSDPEP